MKKRGQLTIFVIMGLVLLILAGLFIFARNSFVQDKPLQDSIWQDSLAPSQIKTFVENCISQVGKEAFVQLGATGGYINPEEYGFFTVPVLPTSSPAIELFPDSGLLLPYWFHLKSSNDCQECFFEVNVPPLRGDSTRSIQSQVNKYVAENIDSCIRDFESFGAQFQIEKIGDISANTEFSRGYTVVTLDYPILIIGNQEIRIKDFESSIDIDFIRIYDTAAKIVQQFELDANARIFEKFTKEIIDAYSIGANTPLPPTEGPTKLDFSAPKIWITTEVEKELKNILSENIPYNQIIGSKRHNIYVSDDPGANVLYNRFGRGLRNVDYTDLARIEIDFNYLPWWPIYLRINPGKGGVIMPETYFSTFLIPIGLQRYRFSYDVAYPIVVTLREDDAFNGEGYTFQYAFEVNLRNNGPFSEEQINITTYEEPDSNSMFADLNQRNSGDVTVETINIITRESLDDVMVSYECVDEAVIVGVTLLTDGKAKTTSKLPICIGGTISGLKQGYFSKGVPLSTSLDNKEKVILELEPISEISLSVMKRPLLKEIIDYVDFQPIYAWVVKENVSQFLEDDERVILIFTKQPGQGEEEFVRFYTIEGSNSTSQPIELISGIYKVEVVMMLDMGENHSRERILIPATEICYDTQPLNPFGGEECVDIPEVTFNSSIVVGGVLFDESTSGFVNITVEDLEKDMILHVIGLKVDDLTLIEDLGQLGLFNEYSTNHSEALKPRFE